MSIEALTRWLSLRAYGVITRTLFGPGTHPKIMRRRFERFGATSRRRLLARHPGLVFAEDAVGPLSVESVHAGSPERAVLYLHGGAFVMGSPASYRTRVWPRLRTSSQRRLSSPFQSSSRWLSQLAAFTMGGPSPSRA